MNAPDLFDPPPSPSEAARELEAQFVRPKPRMEMPGFGTEAKRIAKAKADKTLTGRRGKILMALRAHGKMTRLGIHEVTGLAENSVNSAVASLIGSNHVEIVGLDPATGRGWVALRPEETTDAR